MDIEWKGWGSSYRLGKLHIIHGDELPSSSIYPARNIYLKVSTNILCGHFHKFDRYLHRSYDQQVRGVWVGGCLCTLNPEWMVLPQWTQGIQVVDVMKSGLFHVDQVLYMKRGSGLTTILDGKEYAI